MDVTNWIIENLVSIQGLFAVLFMLILCQMLADICYRLALLWEETYHVESRYRNDWKNAFYAVFKLGTRNMVVYCTIFIISVTVTIAYSYLISTQLLVLPPLYAASYLLLHLVGVWSPRKHEVAEMNDVQNQLGHSFAWQYYYGYLKIILPCLVERMKLFENTQQITIKIKKLFLLMPESCFLPNLLENRLGDDEIIEFIKNLDEIVRNRSGNSERKYSNPVYRISTNLGPVYCCMEGISMLNSLREMCNNQDTEMTEKKRYQQMCYFYSTLKNILEQQKLDHLVELVFYKDRIVQQPVRISEVMLNRIQQLLLESAR